MPPVPIMFKHDSSASPDFDLDSAGAPPALAVQSGGGASLYTSVRGAPRLTGANPPDDFPAAGADDLTVSLFFNEPILRGSGYIYVTDGVAQTVIGRDGKPAMRIVGATDTRAIAVGDTSQVMVINGTALIHVGDLLEGKKYSVLMNKGVFTDLDGNAFAGITSSSTLNFATLEPPPSASIEIDRHVLGTGQTATVTVTFSKPIRALDAEDFLVSSGALGSFTANAERTVWSAAFTPRLGAQDATNLITLPGSAFQDDAGNYGSGSVSSANYVVDLHAPQMMSMATRIGYSTSADLAIAFSEAVYWEDASTISVTGDGDTLTIAPNQVSWSADHKTLTIPAAALGLLPNKVYTVTLPVSLGDQAGNAPGGTIVTLMTTPSSVAAPSEPSLRPGSDNGTLSYDGRSADDTPSFNFSGLIPGGKLRVYDNGVLAGEIDVPANTIGVESWTAPPRTMGTHWFTVSNVDASGKEGPASTPRKLEITDALIDIDLDSLYLQSGASADVTFTFAKAVESLDASAFDVPNATLSGFTGSGTSWKAILTPKAGVDMQANRIELIPENLVFADGSHSTAIGHVSLPYVVDTLVTAWVKPGISIIDDGVSGSDGITSATAQTISGTYEGELQPGDVIALDINGNVHSATVNQATHTWSYTGVVGTGGIELSVAVVRDGRSSAEVGKDFMVDRSGPVALYGTSYTGVGEAQDFILSFEEGEALYWNDASTLSFQGNGQTLTFTRAQLGFVNGDSSLDLPAALHQMVAGRTYTLTLPSGLTDAAGNHPAATYTLTTQGALDTTAPKAQSAIVTTGAGIFGIGDSISIVVRFDEAVWAVDGPSLSLNVGNTATAVYESGNGTADLLFKYVVGAGDLANTLALSAIDLAGKVRDATGNLVAAGDVQFNVITRQGGGVLGIDIDGIAPDAPGTPALAAASDSGMLNHDRITNDTRPVITGNGADAGALINLYSGNTIVGYDWAGSDGSWSVQPLEALGAGTYTFTVTQRDSYDNPSAKTAGVSVTIDTAAPHKNSASSGDGTALTVAFDEAIRFASGSIEVLDGSTVVRVIDPLDTGWYTVSGTTLTLTALGLSDGVYTVKLSADAIADTAGNFTVDLVGSNPGQPWLVGVTA